MADITDINEYKNRKNLLNFNKASPMAKLDILSRQVDDHIATARKVKDSLAEISGTGLDASMNSLGQAIGRANRQAKKIQVRGNVRNLAVPALALGGLTLGGLGYIAHKTRQARHKKIASLIRRLSRPDPLEAAFTLSGLAYGSHKIRNSKQSKTASINLINGFSDIIINS